MTQQTYPITGQCQCGQVSYTLKEAPLMVAACHCQECQTLATAPFSVTAIVAASSIEFKGEMKEWSRPTDSGGVSAATFCPDCGNRVYHYDPNMPEKIKLKLKSHQDADSILYKPTVHIWVSEKQDWYQIPEGVKTIDGQP
ncbi:GFA family protein [Photobacterium sp. DNB22_13_2]